MRFACLLLEHLPTHVEKMLNPELAQQPLAILRIWDDRVLDASPKVQATGVGPGDSRRRLEQLCPQAMILPAREATYQSHHEAMRSVLARFADAIETRALGEFLIEAGTPARTFPSEKAFGLHLAAQVQQAARLPATVGIASNKFTAMQAARRAASEVSRVLAIPQGAERRFLAPLPLAILPDPPVEMVRRLHLFDITTLGGLAQLPRAAVTLQFGAEAVLFHDLARGIDPRPLAPQSPPPIISHTLTLPDPPSDRRLVLAGVDQLAGRVAGALDEAGHHAVALSLKVATADGQEQTTGTAVKPPSANADLLRRLAGQLLGKLQLAAAVSGLTLTAYPLRAWHLGTHQLALFEEPAWPKLAQLQEVVRTLRQRFGEAVLRPASAVGPPQPLSIEVHVRPDGTPGRLRWGGWWRRVKSVYEHWRERRNWWDQPVARDYYQVETDRETVFTVFREADGRWFLDRQRG